MSKRKAQSESIGRSEEGLSDQGCVRTECPVTLPTEIVKVEPTVQTARARVPVNHKGLESATCIERERHITHTVCQVGRVAGEASPLAVAEGYLSPTGVPLEPVETLPEQVVEGEGPAASWFWGLLRDAGYEVWWCRGHRPQDPVCRVYGGLVKGRACPLPEIP